jgi:peptidoglycan hydrolase-like protein with peptidoglycan-binding domain
MKKYLFILLMVAVFGLAPTANAALTETQITAIISLLTSFGADATTIANVDASLRGGSPTTMPNPTPTPPGSNLCTRLMLHLKMGSRGADVTRLQLFLKARGHLNAEATGYFGAMTQAAVRKFQAENNISSTGEAGPMTRARIVALTCVQ